MQPHLAVTLAGGLAQLYLKITKDCKDTPFWSRWAYPSIKYASNYRPISPQNTLFGTGAFAVFFFLALAELLSYECHVSRSESLGSLCGWMSDSASWHLSAFAWKLFVDGASNFLSAFGLMVSLRASLPLFNGLILPKAPEVSFLLQIAENNLWTQLLLLIQEKGLTALCHGSRGSRDLCLGLPTSMFRSSNSGSQQASMALILQ